MTNRNVIASGIYQKNTIHVKPLRGERCLVCVPFCYPYGFLTSVIMPLLCGRVAILSPNMNAQNVDYYLNKKPHYIFGSPAALTFFQRNCSANIDMSSVHTFVSGGDYLSAAQILRGKAYFKAHGADVEICNGSGNAEACGVITEPVGVRNEIDKVGKPLVGTKAIVVDPATMKELQYGEEGMLCIAGKHVFKEYFGEPALTQAAMFRYQGTKYYKTGTMGILDREGYFTLTGRISRFYIRSDFNKVYCEHLQNIMNTLPCIDSCAVVKKPDEQHLFVSKAFVVLGKGYPPNDETRHAIYELLNALLTNPPEDFTYQLKPYEIPAEIAFIDELPRNAADKVDYRALEALERSSD